MVENAETGRMAEPGMEQASFWEIFKHSWPILFERPKPLLALMAVMAVAAEAVD